MHLGSERPKKATEDAPQGLETEKYYKHKLLLLTGQGKSFKIKCDTFFVTNFLQKRVFSVGFFLHLSIIY
jgi:hypothetical protein